MKRSAGILVYRQLNKFLEFFLVHPGGPFWKNKDLGCWTIPKGEYLVEEDPFKAALREFKEETGQDINGNFIPLSPLKQSSVKLISAWAVEGNIDENNIHSNHVELSWPPHSNKKISFPEIDRGEWFNYNESKQKILKGQIPFLDELKNKLENE